MKSLLTKISARKAALSLEASQFARYLLGSLHQPQPTLRPIRVELPGPQKGRSYSEGSRSSSHTKKNWVLSDFNRMRLDKLSRKSKISPLDDENILIEASKGSEDLFIALLLRFSSEDMILDSEATEKIFKNLLAQDSDRGIRILGQILVETPGYYFGLNIWDIKSYAMIEALIWFFEVTPEELGELFTGSKSWTLRPEAEVSSEVLELFVEVLKIPIDRLEERMTPENFKRIAPEL